MLPGLAASALLLVDQRPAEPGPRTSPPQRAVPALERAPSAPADHPDSRRNFPPDADRPAPDRQAPAARVSTAASAGRPITLSGRLTTEFGEALAGETVVLYSPSRKTHHTVVSGAAGGFEFVDLEPSWDYVLKVSPRQRYRTFTRTSIDLSAEYEIRDIVLEAIPLGRLAGGIVDSYGRPVAGIELRIKAVDASGWDTRVATDAYGGFFVAEWPAGRFRLASTGRQTLDASGLVFDPGSAAPITLGIDRGPFELDGRILDQSGQAFAGADVFLHWTSIQDQIIVRSRRKTSAGTLGEFRFTGLGPGKHELVVTAWRDETDMRTVRKPVDLGVDSSKVVILLDTQ